MAQTDIIKTGHTFKGKNFISLEFCNPSPMKPGASQDTLQSVT